MLQIMSQRMHKNILNNRILSNNYSSPLIRSQSLTLISLRKMLSPNQIYILPMWVITFFPLDKHFTTESLIDVGQMTLLILQN